MAATQKPPSAPNNTTTISAITLSVSFLSSSVSYFLEGMAATVCQKTLIANTSPRTLGHTFVGNFAFISIIFRLFLFCN